MGSTNFDKSWLKNDFYNWVKNQLLITVKGVYKYNISFSESKNHLYTSYHILINNEPKFYFDCYQEKKDFYLICFYYAVEEYINTFGVPEEWVDFSVYLFKGELNMKFYRKFGTEKNIHLLLNNKFLKTKINEYICK